jgi:hypothetical protein
LIDASALSIVTSSNKSSPKKCCRSLKDWSAGMCISIQSDHKDLAVKTDASQWVKVQVNFFGKPLEENSKGN